MKSIVKIATTVAAAAAVGAILGVLFAPDKGTETRKKISKQGRDVADDFKNSFSKGKKKMDEIREDLAKSLKEKVEEFV